MKYTLGFLFSPGGHGVVLIQKKQPLWQMNRFNGVGGKIEESETPLESMRREFEEETALAVHDWHCFCILSGNDWEVHCFCAHSKDWEDVRTRTDEEVSTWSVTGLPVNVLPNVRWLIPMALSMGLGEPCRQFEVRENQ